MVEAALSVLAVVSLTVLGAHLADRVFARLRIPDIPLLLGLGGIIGPIGGLVTPGAFDDILPILAAVAITVVVLDGALLLSARETARLSAEGALLSVGVFGATVLIVSLFVHLLLGLDGALSILLGAMVGGAGIIIVIPLVGALGASPAAVGIVTIEAVIADLFVVLAVSVLAAWWATTASAPTLLVGSAVGIGIAVLVGAIGAALWGLLTWRREGSEYEYVATLALLLGVYALTESYGGVSVVAVLVFGLIVGRLPLGARLAPRTHFRPTTAGRRDRVGTVFRDEGRAHHDVVFLVRAFFFVGLGIVLDWSAFARGWVLAAGALTAVGVALARILITVWLLREPRWVRRDRDAVAIMFPLGLVAAVTSVIPLAHGLPGSAVLPAIVAVALVLTNVLSALGVWLFRRAYPMSGPSAS